MYRQGEETIPKKTNDPPKVNEPFRSVNQLVWFPTNKINNTSKTNITALFFITIFLMGLFNYIIAPFVLLVKYEKCVVLYILNFAPMLVESTKNTMTGTFNERGTGDYALTITEKEFSFLQKGTVTLGDITAHWNGVAEKHQLRVSIKPRSYLEKLKEYVKNDTSLGIFYQSMWSVVVVKKDKEHVIYYGEDCDLSGYPTVQGRVCESRYCEVLQRKLILLITTE